MKYLIFILLTIPFVCTGQTVPNTETFTLQNVYDAVNYHTPATTEDLQSCFDNLDSVYLDPYYSSTEYAPANSLLQFRNYRPPLDVVIIEATSVGIDEATILSQVNSDGGSSVTSRGVCWSTEPTPTISGSYNTSGSGIGEYSTDMENLHANTAYYVRAFATNSTSGTVYSDEIVIVTLSATDIDIYVEDPYLKVGYLDCTQKVDTTYAVLRLEVSSNTLTILESGIVWAETSTATLPSLADADASVTDGVGGNHVSCLTMSSLTANTNYTVRAWADTEENDIVYGNVIEFSTRGGTTFEFEVGDEIDGDIIVSVDEYDEYYEVLAVSEVLNNDQPLDFWHARRLQSFPMGLPTPEQAYAIRTYIQSFTPPAVCPLNIPTNRHYWIGKFTDVTIIVPIRWYRGGVMYFGNQDNWRYENANTDDKYYVFLVKGGRIDKHSGGFSLWNWTYW
jgi:hypothetical protein